MSEKAVVIVSGGIDSSVALYWAANEGFDTRPICFMYGQRHLREIMYAREQVEELRRAQTSKRRAGLLEIIEIPWMNSLKSSALTNPEIPVPSIKEVLGHPQPVTYVPFRNLLFLTIALQFAEDVNASSVVYGAQLHDLYGYWDATREFVERLNALVTLNRQHRISVVAPLADNSKAGNILLGKELGVNFALTYSCYVGRPRHCGICPTCAERKKGFIDAGVVDPTSYEVA